MRLVLFFVLFFVFSSPALANNYRAGSAGFLMEECQKALKSRTAIEFLDSYCGSFLSSYAMGAFTANYILLADKTGDRCEEDYKKAYKHIEGRFCPEIGRIFKNNDNNKKSMPVEFKTPFQLFLLMSDYKKSLNEGDEFLNTLAPQAINKTLNEPEFCEYLQSIEPENLPQLEINPEFMDSNQQLKLIKNSLDWSSKGEMAVDVEKQCQADIEYADGSEDKFKATKCSGAISGYIAGLYSTKHLQNNRPDVSLACYDEIDELYERLDITKRDCVSYNMPQLQIAEKSVEQIEKLKRDDEHNPYFSTYPSIPNVYMQFANSDCH